MIFPVAVIGSSSTNSTLRGYSCAARRVFTNDWMSATKASDGSAPLRSTIQALTISVRTGSGTPATAAIITAGCLMRHSSISPGPMR